MIVMQGLINNNITPYIIYAYTYDHSSNDLFDNISESACIRRYLIIYLNTAHQCDDNMQKGHIKFGMAKLKHRITFTMSSRCRFVEWYL